MSPAGFVCRAILFDLDGVLADSTVRIDAIWRTWAGERGLDGDAIMKVAHGRRAEEVIRSVAPHLPAAEEVALIEEREVADVSGVVVIPGADALLRALPPHSWAVVTSGTTALATARLEMLGLPWPEVLVTADDVAEGKPHPEGYLAAARRLGADTSNCVVVEDAPPGIEAAHAGGMTVIGVTTTYEPDDLAAAEAIVDTLEQVTLARTKNDGRGLPLLELEVAGAPDR